jgi:pilus assembly protein TadC
MTAMAPMLAAFAVALVGHGRQGRAGRHLPDKHGSPAADRIGGVGTTAWSRQVGKPGMTRASSAALGVAMALVVGGVFGIATGIAAIVVADRVVRKLEPGQVRQRRRRREVELPLTLDLLSVCLQAGMPLVAALETVVGALPGPFSEDLCVVAGLQRLGAAAPSAWAELAADQDLAPVARAVRRSAESGSRLAAAFDRLAADRRSALAASGLARARSAGVIAMAPLGLCFLPAFVCLGIVPIVLSLAAEVLP